MTSASANPASSAVCRARRRGLVSTSRKSVPESRAPSATAVSSPSGSSGRSVIDVCRPAVLHSVAPWRTNHSSVPDSVLMGTACQWAARLSPARRERNHRADVTVVSP